MESMTEFWDVVHANKMERYQVNTRYGKVMNTLAVKKMLKPGIKVLEIGVGNGDVAIKLKQLGCDVSAVDISKVALDRLASILTRGYLNTEWDQLPNDTFDLITCHLVCQYITNTELAAMLRNCIRSLKRDGIMALQFSESDLLKKFSEAVDDQKDGDVHRGPGYMARAVYYAGGKVVLRKEAGNFPHQNSCWWVFHVQKLL